MLVARPMQRLTTFIGVLMLVLFIWTSSSAHAAQRFDCIPASSSAPGHFQGDRDEALAKGEKGAAHYHNGCNGHQYAASAAMTLPPFPGLRTSAADGLIERFATSRGPDERLRPPIA